MSSIYGEYLKISIFGQSHGTAIGMCLDGFPAGMEVDHAALQAFLARRAPGQGDYATPRKEADEPEFLSGLVNGVTCGAPIAAIIRNTNTRSADYTQLKDRPRPGHSDYTAQIKYCGSQDSAGGGHFSGRLTAPLCIGGGLCLQWLSQKGIHIASQIASIADVEDSVLDPIFPDLSEISSKFPVIDAAAGEKMLSFIREAKQHGDSVGGTIRCYITGLPAGLGGPLFGGVEGKLSQILFGIPAVKGVEFGAGFAGSKMAGSEHNDPFTVQGGKIITTTNNCGGILGGITNGMPLVFRVAVKPTPSIAMPQQTVDLNTGENTTLSITGRHDPCIVPRAVPVVEAAAAIAITDLILSNNNEG